MGAIGGLSWKLWVNTGTGMGLIRSVVRYRTGTVTVTVITRMALAEWGNFIYSSDQTIDVLGDAVSVRG